MPWRDALHPLSMQRVALVVPRDGLRDLLVEVADDGSVEFDEPPRRDGDPGVVSPAAASLERLQAAAPFTPRLAAGPPDLAGWEQAGRVDLIAGEAQLQQHAFLAVDHGSVSAIAGWMPADDLPRLAHRVNGIGGAVVPLPPPAGVQPPTLLTPSGTAHEFAPLVQTYATVPYADIDPSVLAGLAYVAMFGMMFADVAHGALLLLVAVAIRMQWSKRLQRLRPAWLFLAGAGLASMTFGALYGEFFGPTGVVPVVWLAPLDHPVPLLAAAVGVGAVLLAGAYALGTVNRVREGGWRRGIYAPSGLAGAALYVGLGLVAGGLVVGLDWLAALGGTVAVAGLAVAFLGLLTAAGGGAGGAAQAAVESFDLVVRLGSNLVSFARLAAFGLTHAALGAVVWQATTGLWRHGVLAAAGAIVIFAVGNALTFALEGLVAGIQALRLEYYELFSRIFDSEGRPFHPWHAPTASTEAPC